MDTVFDFYISHGMEPHYALAGTIMLAALVAVGAWGLTVSVMDVKPQTSLDASHQLRDALAAGCYMMSEPHLSGYRLVIGFETMPAVHNAMQSVAKAVSEFRTETAQKQPPASETNVNETRA